MSKVLKFVLRIIIALALILVGFIIFIWITRYQPADIEVVQPIVALKTGVEKKFMNDTLRLVTWNIGYAGLGKNMNFFYDGGQRVRCGRQETLDNLRGIIHHKALTSSPDFILLQEVDFYAQRTYFINEVDTIINAFPGYMAWLGKNYDVKFVPVPWYNPMGRVVAGILTLSPYTAIESLRLKLPGEFDFITQLFMLNRCALLLRFPIHPNKDLVIFNTHNTAFDDGTQRIVQWNFLQKLALNEYNQGNYVIVGGDFNLNPPCFNPSFITTGDKAYRQVGDFPPCNAFPQGWQFVYQKEYPTNRNLDTPYVKGKTPVTTIDFFILSPNISCLRFKTWYDGFQFSDHHPVEVEVVLQK